MATAHDYQMTFGLTDEGKLTLADLERFASWDKADFVENPARAAYIQGQRSVIAHIKKKMQGD